VNQPLSGTVEDMQTDAQRVRNFGSQCAQRGFADSGVAWFRGRLRKFTIGREEILSRFIYYVIGSHVISARLQVAGPRFLPWPT